MKNKMKVMVAMALVLGVIAITKTCMADFPVGIVFPQADFPVGAIVQGLF